jgi:hypothetical protein
MQEPARYDITIHQGATFLMEVQYKDGNGTPVNMSGYAVEGQLWNRNGTARLAEFVFAWQVQASGMFSMKIPSTVTSGITEQGSYDFLVTEPSGDQFYLLEGTAFWNPGLSYKP